ncbi:MAG: hypothetical protein JXR70_01965 [Spirochaetales bacterium]|nr:hypothetical protein [Spirochaetales bacterium]
MLDYFFKNSPTKRFRADDFRPETFEGEAAVVQSPARAPFQGWGKLQKAFSIYL